MGSNYAYLQPNTIPYAQSSSSDVVFLALLTFTIPDRPDIPPLRVVNNTVNIVSRGLTFQAYPFNLTMPDDQPDKIPTVSIEISNIDRALMIWLRGFPVAPQLMVEVITNVNYDVVERSIGYLKLEYIDYDALSIKGTLSLDNGLARRFPGDDYDPVQFPGLYAI